MILHFTITFHGPFRVGTGRASSGMDDTVDRANLLVASSLKGVMADAAARVLRLPASLRDEVFGAAGTSSPWAWSSAKVVAPKVRPRATVRIGPHGVAADDMLAVREQVWADSATFTVEQMGWVADPYRHGLLLTATACAVTAIGGQRRRGHGWVSVTGGRDLGPDDISQLLAWREG